MSDWTPGPWEWWTSCSWRRLKQRAIDGRRDVLMPFASPTDGHPDIEVSEADMRLIAAAPEMALLLDTLTEPTIARKDLDEYWWWLCEVRDDADALLAKIRGED